MKHRPHPIQPIGTRVGEARPVFAWTAVPKTVRYRLMVQWWTPSGNHDYRFETTVSGQETTYTPAPDQALEADIHYFWTVRAENESGAGPWAHKTHFIVDTRERETLVLDARPFRNQTSKNPVFHWFPRAKAERYRLMVRRQVANGRWDYHFEEVIAAPETSFQKTSAVHDLVPGNYFWTVRWEQASQSGPWAEKVFFTYRESWVLEAPTPRTPAAGVLNARPIFSWDPVETAERYRLNVKVQGDNGGYVLAFETVCHGPAHTEHRPGDDFGSTFSWKPGNYRWTVRAEARNLTPSAWAPGTDFSYQLSAPSATPEPLSPGEDQEAAPTLVWEAVTGADRYRVEIAEAGRPIVAVHTENTRYSPPFPLAPGNAYTWRVKALNDAGESSFSEAMALTVAPAQVVVLKETGVTTATARPQLALPTAGQSFEDAKVFRLLHGRKVPFSDFHLLEAGRLLEPTTPLVEHAVYLITHGGKDYAICYDTAHHPKRLNVVAFGGKPLAEPGNLAGAFNNRAALQAAVDALDGPGIVFIPQGIWMVGREKNGGQLSQIQVKAGLHLQGAGLRATALVPDTMHLGTQVWAEALLGHPHLPCDGFRLSNLTISGLYAEPSEPPRANLDWPTYRNHLIPLRLSGKQIRIENVALHFVEYGMLLGRRAQASQASISRCRIQFADKGLFVLNTEHSVIAANDIRECDSQGIFLGEIETKPKVTNRDIRIVANRVIGGQARGIHCGELAGGLILANEVLLQQGHPRPKMSTGILANGRDLVIMENRVAGAALGLLESGKYQAVQGNGIKLENGPDHVLVAHNELSDSETDGITLSAANTHIAVVENQIRGSGQRGIRLRSGSYSDFGPPDIRLSPFPNNTTQIESVFLADNAISDCKATGDTHYIPRFPEIQTPSQGTRYQFNILDGNTATFPSKLAAQNIRDLQIRERNQPRDIALFANPYYRPGSLQTPDRQPIPDRIIGIGIAFSFASSLNIMLDEQVTGLRIADTGPPAGPGGYRIQRILANGEIDPTFRVDIEPSLFQNLVDLLTLFRSDWENRYGSPQSESERSCFEKLEKLISHYREILQNSRETS